MGRDSASSRCLRRALRESFVEVVIDTLALAGRYIEEQPLPAPVLGRAEPSCKTLNGCAAWRARRWGVHPAGSIKTYQDALTMIRAGAYRIGARAGGGIVQESEA